MGENIEWKEAKGGQILTDSEEENDEGFKVKTDPDQADLTFDSLQYDEPINDDREEADKEERLDAINEIMDKNVFDLPSSSLRTFSHQQINLSLRRNITALADPNQHKEPKQTFSFDKQLEPFDSWLENAIVAASPNADILLFSSPNPSPLTFFAKLRMEPINQYITKALEIPLDFNEQVTCLLCLPIMSTRKTALGSVDWTALVVGLSSGYVKFYNEQSICLLSLKFCDEPAISIKCQTMKSNSNARSESHFASIVDEILITFKTLAIVVDGLCLYENLRISRDEVIKNGSNYEPAYDLTNLPSILNCQKWKIDDQTKNSLVIDADLLGIRRTTVFDSMMSDSVNFENIPTKACARTLVIVGRDPFISCYRESKETTSHSYTEIIGSIFSLWNKPQPTRMQMTEVSNSSNISLLDKGRLATSITPSPDKRLIAVTDDYGRVLLVDATNWLAVRVWKGYRSAQCGWIEVKRDPDKRGCPHASFLVIYAPKRGLLEVWSSQRGPRVAAFNVGKSCRLLYSGYKMFNMRADQSQKGSSFAEQTYSSNCYLLNSKSETVFSIELPYTYSLYKYGDLKSRDQLLIGELVNAIQQDSEVELISEILHRLALAKSIQKSIKKIAPNLCPGKNVTLMENLIVKTMKNYDNHAGETMTDDDMSIIELCKRLIRLCSIFKELSERVPIELSLPDVNQRLIDQYEEHPQEIDEFSEQLGWFAPEILRYLSLLTLERSYRKSHQSNPWPSTGEPLVWAEFISCFDLNRKKLKKDQRDLEKVSIRLRELNSKFLNEDKVLKTALFLYHRLSENYHKSSQLSTRQTLGDIANNYNYLEPSSRLALLFQFWLSTKLCNYWKMWAFLQNQVGQISDELKVIAMGHDNDKILIESWKPIYNLILESDNIYAAIIATAVIRSDTVRTIQDNEKREKLEASQRELTSQGNDESKTNTKQSTIGWECLCIDAERMSILSQQLEDVFLLNLLLKYSITDGYLIESYLYRVPRISVANILRGGPTIVSELVAQWAVQSNVNSKIFTQAYGKQLMEEEQVNISGPSTSHTAHSIGNQRSRLFMARPAHLDSEEHARELLHHAKASFPCSLDPDILLVNCVWELCRRWTSNPSASDKVQPLLRAYDCLLQISCPELRRKLASMAYKTFFQRTFERLVILIETNSTLLSAKNSRTRDTIARKELNMSDDCLEEFVQFCCDISEFMLQTSIETDKSDPEKETESKNRLLTLDDWWATPTVVKMLDGPDKHQRRPSQFSIASGSSCDDGNMNSLIKTTLFATNLLSVDVLVELNRLANLMNLIFKLKIVKAYPMSSIGDESRQILQFDLQQSSVGTAIPDMKNRTGSLSELRHKFARKCIVSIVNKMAGDTNEFSYDDEFDEDVDTNLGQLKQSSMSAAGVAKQTKDKANKTSGKLDAANSGLLDGNSDDMLFLRDENNESMVLFANLLSLANEWQLNCDELHLELVFELYRCNLDKIASQISTRISDQQSLANGLLKISSQRVLVLFGLSPHISGSDWRKRSDKWSIFQPNVASWLKSIQQEEMRREIACLSFSDSLKPSSISSNVGGSSFGVEIYVLLALRRRTKLVLEKVTNHLDGQARRLAYDLLQLLESQHFDRQLIRDESES